jgi:hypothetical protein
VRVVDSLSHAWRELTGEVDRITQASASKNSFLAWGKANPKQKRLNYSNTGIVSKWKNKFSKPEPPKSKRAERKAPEPEEDEKSDGPALRLIKEAPIIFQLRRSGNPLDFDRMAFVAKVVSKAADRPHFAGVHVERTKTGCRIAACDDRRLHVAEITQKIKSGDYKPVLTKEAITLCEPKGEIRFLAWRKVIPGNTNMRGVIDLENAGFGQDRKQTENLSSCLQRFSTADRRDNQLPRGNPRVRTVGSPLCSIGGCSRDSIPLITPQGAKLDPQNQTIRGSQAGYKVFADPSKWF